MRQRDKQVQEALVQGKGQPRSEPGAGSWYCWLLALVPAAMLLALLSRRVWDVDIFWQLKLGELILARAGPVRAEPFAALHLGEPLTTICWLGQAVMAQVRLLGGWGLLRVFDALCWLGGLWAPAAACRARGARLDAVMLALLLAFFASFHIASIRPQSFAVLCFGLLLALRRFDPGLWKTMVLGAPLMVLWQNLHPSVSIGVLTMGASAVPGWLGWIRDRNARPPWAPTVLALIGCAAMFATPDGLAILAISARNAEASMAIGASEWLPLWIPANRITAIPVAFVALMAALMVLRHRDRADAGELAAAVALLVLTVTAYRFALFWAAAMVPVIARAASGPPEMSKLPRGAVAGLVALAAVLAPAVLPTRFSASIPLDAIARLKRENLRGTIYADFPYGGAIIDAGYPAWRVAYDGRYYRYSSDEWKYNGGIENGFVPLVDVVRKWRPAAFVLNANHNAPLAGELARSRRWQRIYAREGIVVYVAAPVRIRG